jgi:hypothetical protein
MQLARPAFARDSRKFGRGPVRELCAVRAEWSPSDEFKLFATTFAAGFLFVSILIG